VDCKGLHFGPFEINLEAHELRKHGLRIKLSEQPFHVLVLLLERRGEVVTRSELRSALWPGQNWGDLDHRLNKAINRVRDALGDSAEAPRYLETLPKIGYRFVLPATPMLPVAPVVAALVPAERAVEVPMPMPAAARRRSPVWTVAAGVILLAGLMFALPAVFRAFAKKGGPSWLGMEATPLTTYVGAERYPCFSPDGSRVVFAWNGEEQKVFHLFETAVNPGAPRQLTDGAENDYGPAWSPDGRSIAFVREIGRGQVELRVMSPEDGGGRKVAQFVAARTDHPISWTKDSRWLVVAANPAGDGPPALFLFSAETGERRRLTSPPLQSGGDVSPAISPDGTRLAFTRSTSAAWRDVFVVALSNDLAPVGEPVRITNLKRWVDTITWTADGRALYFAASATMAGSRFLYRVSAVAVGDHAVTETGIEGSDPAAGLAGGALAYVRHNLEQTSTWRLQVPPASAPGPPRWSRLMSSTRRDFTADLSPDGKRLVFSSARSGPTEIWISNLDGSGLKRVTSLGATPRWSPDGRRIAFESTADGQSEIYAIEVDSGSLVRLTNEPGADIYPSWSRDGRFLYFSSDRSGTPQIWKIPSGGGEARQITRHGGSYAVETFDGKTIYYTTPQQPAAIRFAASDGGEEKDAIDVSVGLSSIAMAPDGLYYLSSLSSAGATLDFFAFGTRASRRLTSIDRPVHHVLSGSPDGRSVVFTQIDREDTDLMMVRSRDAR